MIKYASHFETPVPRRVEVLIVGAGLAGLSAGRLLAQQGVDVHLIEASDAVGGRIRTDVVDGFLLDRGFQVLLTAYEEVHAQVDLNRLALRSFRPGALIWGGTSLERLTDPFRDPGGALASLSARVGSWRDKMRVAALRRRVLAQSAASCFSGPTRSTLDELRELGFSEGFIDAFFRSFLGGVFLERELDTPAALFRYYFRCFAAGRATVPARGMQRLPELLAGSLDGRITFGASVAGVRHGIVTLEDGRKVYADDVIVAVDGWASSQLLGTTPPGFNTSVTSYFATPEAPIQEPLLVLDGAGTGPVNHVAVMSTVAPEYAPDGMHLVAVSGVGAATDDPTAFAAAAPRQMRTWFGASVDRWSHLRTYRVVQALPRHPTGFATHGRRPPRVGGAIVAGDYTEFGSIQGALASGRRAAEAVLGRRTQEVA